MFLRTLYDLAEKAFGMGPSLERADFYSGCRLSKAEPFCPAIPSGRGSRPLFPYPDAVVDSSKQLLA
jgi:hypothetical protein